MAEVDVLVDEAVDEHEPASDPRGVGQHRGALVAVGVALRGPHVALRVAGVVPVPARDGCAGDGGLEHAGLLGQAHDRHVAAVAPAVDPDPVQVDEAALGQRAQRIDLVRHLEVPEVFLDRALEREPSAPAPPVVDRHDEVAEPPQVLGPEGTGAGPRVGDELRVRPAVDRDDGGERTLPFGHVERGVERLPVARGDGRQRRWDEAELGDPRVRFVEHHPLLRPVPERAERDGGRPVDAVVDVEEARAAVVGHHSVGPRSLRHPRRLAPAVQVDPVEVALGRSVRRTGEPEVGVRRLGGERCDAVDHPRPRGQRPLEGAVRGAHLEVAEARALRGPDEAAIGQRPEAVVDVDPHVALLDEERRGRAGRRVDPEQLQPGLRPVEDLHREHAVIEPVDPGEVAVGEARQVGPHRLGRPLALGWDGRDRQPDRCVGGAGEGVAVVLLRPGAHGV